MPNLNPIAREFWKRIESLHAVTYFGSESTEAAKEAGLRGFWMGYFGFRGAPLGRVGPGVVEAAFANFAPNMVRRSLPDAWDFADPDELIAARADAASGTLQRLVPDISELADEVNETLWRIIEAAAPIARPLFSANRDVGRLDDAVAQLWQHCTTLREQRGDGHVIALASAGLDGCQAHQMLIAAQQLPVELFQKNRGWSDEDWAAAAVRLQERGLTDADGLTPEGRRVHDEAEELTDSLAAAPIVRVLSEPEAAELVAALTPAAVAISASGVLPFPNPMGLPKLDEPTPTR